MRAIGLGPVQFTFTVVAAAALAVALLLMSSSSTAEAQTVDDSFNITYTTTVGSTATGVPRSQTTTFGVEYPGNINFGNLITFEPAATLTRSCNTDTDSDGYAEEYFPGNLTCLEAGDKIGTLTSATVLSVINSPCNQGFDIDFTFYAVATPNFLDSMGNPTTADLSTNLAFTQPEGTSNRFDHWDTTATIGSPPTDIAVDAGTTIKRGLGVQDGGDGSVHTSTSTTNIVDGVPDGPEASLTDTTQSWLTDQWVGYTVKDLTSGDQFVITSNDSDTVFGVTWLDGIPTGTTPPLLTGGIYQILGVKATPDNIMFKNYPQYMLDLFRTAGGTPIIPTVLYGASTFVAGTAEVPLYFAVFDPDDLAAAGFHATNPLSRAADADAGFVSQTVLNDPTQTSANLSNITGFCATTSVTTLDSATGVGPGSSASSVTRATNPTSAGTHFNMGWAASQRDVDNDGVENSLDTCFKDVNIDPDPRTAASIVFPIDNDMIDSVCDTIANGFLGPGVGDNFQATDSGWFNIQDNCPEVANPGQQGSETSVGVDGGYAAGRALDGGPLGDAIGDVCDIGTVTGLVYNDQPTSITLSPTIANGRWAIKALVTAICYGGTDLDGDGYCSTEDAFDAALPASNVDRHDSWTLSTALNPVLGVTSVSGGAGAFDTDGGNGSNKGYDSDWLETHVGTDARQPCSLTSAFGDEPTDAWLFDTNDDQSANFGDILPVSPFFLQVATTAGHRRFDWNADGFINFGDVLAIAPVFLQTCSPIVGPQ